MLILVRGGDKRGRRFWGTGWQKRVKGEAIFGDI
jgi:hypothetical protein